jgi:hypothetical protein
MSRILITGMSASQGSAKLNSRSLGFTGAVNRSLINSGHEVVWEIPSIDWTDDFFESFDAIIVGVSPITSLSANYMYGGLNTIDRTVDTGKLTLLVDAPTPRRIGASLRTTLAKPETFTKDFYSSKHGFQRAAEPAVRTRLLSTVERLLEQDWPTTIYPSLPWQDSQKVAQQVTAQMAKNLIGLSLDAELIEQVEGSDKRLKWSADELNSPWTKSVLPSLIYPVSPMKWHKGWEDSLVKDQLARSTGALIAPHQKDETWWTYRYVQAINTGTPVATYWQETMGLDYSWSLLAAEIETLSTEKRDNIANKQRCSYIDAIPKVSSARAALQKTLNINAMKGTK